MGSWNPGFDIHECSCPAWGGYSHLFVARLYAVAAAGSGSNTAKGLFPVVVAAATAAVSYTHLTLPTKA